MQSKEAPIEKQYKAAKHSKYLKKKGLKTEQAFCYSNSGPLLFADKKRRPEEGSQMETKGMVEEELRENGVILISLEITWDH